MGAIFSRVKTWTTNEDVQASDLNAEFDNILDNLIPAQLDDYSTNTAAMQATTDPGESGTESLATTLAGEIERLRFAIGEIKGTSQWYESATTSLSDLSNSVGGGLPTNRISTGKTQSGSSQLLALVPNGAAATLVLEGATTNFTYYIQGTQYTISSDVSITGLTTAPTSQNTALVNDTNLNAEDRTKQVGEFGTQITIDTVGTNITSLDGKIGAFKIVHSGNTEYFIARVDTSNNRLINCKRGYFFDSSDAIFDKVAIADGDTITLMKLTWVFAKTDGTLAVTYNPPTVSTTAPSSPALGDYWFDITNDLWKTYNSTTWVDATALLVGTCIQDENGNTVGARTFDQYKNNDDLLKLSLTQNGNAAVRTQLISNQATIFGATVKYENSYVDWDMTVDLDTGITEAASTMYYFYLDENGETIISDVSPHDYSQEDRKGLYHPAQTWRCVGQAYNNASSNLEAVISYDDTSDRNYAVTNSVSASALTLIVHANPLSKFQVKNATAASAELTYLQIPYPIELTVTSGATLGHADATNEWIYIYALSYLNNPELAVASIPYEGASLLTSTAMSAGADSRILYSNKARTDASPLLLARAKSNQTTAGTYAAVATEIVHWPFEKKLSKVVSTGSSTYTTTSTSFTSITNLSVTITIEEGKKVLVGLEGDSTSAGTGFIGSQKATVDAGASYRIYRDGATVVSSTYVYGGSGSGSTNSQYVPCSAVTALDNPGAGTFTYVAQAAADSSCTAYANNVRLYAIEVD